MNLFYAGLIVEFMQVYIKEKGTIMKMHQLSQKVHERCRLRPSQVIELVQNVDDSAIKDSLNFESSKMEKK